MFLCFLSIIKRDDGAYMKVADALATLKKASGAAGTKAAPLLGKLGGGAAVASKAAAPAAKGAAWGLGAAAGGGIVDSIGDPGFVLFIAGLATFFFQGIAENVILALLLGSVFLFFSSIFIFKGKGMAITVLFWIWYVFLGGTTNPQTIVYLLPILLGAGMVAHGLASKISHRDTFASGAAGELIGLAPVLFFFLDLGLIEFLTKYFNITITTTLKYFIVFIPWWALLGLFTTKKENWLLSLLRIGGIIYVFSILLFGVAPEIYASYTSLVPGPEQFLQAKQQIQAQLPHGENPAISNLVCSLTEYTDVQNCVKRRQMESEIKDACKRIEGKEEGTKEYEDCFAAKKMEREEQKVAVSGVEDPTMKEPMKAEFVVSDFFPGKKEPVFRNYDDESSLYFPITLEIKNPRKQEFKVRVSCKLIKALGQEEIPGQIEGKDGLEVTESSQKEEFVCRTPEGARLKGSHKVVFEAELQGLISTSRLQRAFIGIKDAKWKEEWVSQILVTHFPGQSYLSQASPDFARLNFAFGSPSAYPIIEGAKNIVLSSTIENIGPGEIMGNVRYELFLPEFGIEYEVRENNCKKGEIPVPLIEKKYRQKIFHLPTCLIESLPQALEEPKDYVFMEFVGLIQYSYLIKKEIEVKIEVVGEPRAEEEAR